MKNTHDSRNLDTADMLMHENTDQTLVNSLHGLLNFEIGGLDSCYYNRAHTSCPLYTQVPPIL